MPLYKRIFLSFACVLFTLSMSSSLNAGIFSGLAKLGKAAKKIDSPNPAKLRQADLPEAHKHLESTEIVPNTNGNWDVKLNDGSKVTIQSLVTSGQISNKLFVIRSLDVPKNTKLIDKIPKNVPVYIKGKNNRFYTLNRGPKSSVAYKNVSLELTKTLTISKAIYHLEKPLLSSKSRFVQLTNKADETLATTVYGSRIGLETAGIESFIKQLDNLKHQSIVLAGQVKDGVFYSKTAGKNGISLSDLRKAADKNSINLTLLNSDKPNTLLKLLAKSEALNVTKGTLLNNTVGDFFNSMSLGKNAKPIKIAASADGRSNVAIQFSSNVTRELVTKSGAIPNQLHLTGLLLRSATIYQTSEAQDSELQEINRKKTQKQNAIILYPVLSFILGLFSGATSKLWWSKIWNFNSIQLNGSLIWYRVKQLLNKLLFFAIFLPLMGIWCFWFAMLKGIFKIIHSIFIKPIIWVREKFS